MFNDIRNDFSALHAPIVDQNELLKEVVSNVDKKKQCPEVDIALVAAYNYFKLQFVAHIFIPKMTVLIFPHNMAGSLGSTPVLTALHKVLSITGPQDISTMLNKRVNTDTSSAFFQYVLWKGTCAPA